MICIPKRGVTLYTLGSLTAFRYINKTPILAMKNAREEPALIKGNGKPVAGMEEVTTAIFITV